MKTLNDGRIQVESGDTLSGIYGSNWKEASGYTGDPTKLQIGTILPAKSSSSLGGSLTPGASETSGGLGRSLPNQQVDGLSMFGEVLKMVTQRAMKDSAARGGEALPEGVLKPSQMSGGSFADIMSSITEQKTQRISDIYESTVNMISASRARADKQLQTLINTQGITKLDDKTLEQFSGMTDYSFDQLKAIKTSIQEQGTTETEDSSDRESRYKLGLLADKAGQKDEENPDAPVEKMSYEDAVNTYGHVLDLDYIDRVYGKGKYLGIEAEEDFYKKIEEWEKKVKDNPEKYYREEDSVGVKYKEKRSWLGIDKLSSDEVKFEYPFK